MADSAFKSVMSINDSGTSTSNVSFGRLTALRNWLKQGKWRKKEKQTPPNTPQKRLHPAGLLNSPTRANNSTLPLDLDASDSNKHNTTNETTLVIVQEHKSDLVPLSDSMLLSVCNLKIPNQPLCLTQSLYLENEKTECDFIKLN